MRTSSWAQADPGVSSSSGASGAHKQQGKGEGKSIVTGPSAIANGFVCHLWHPAQIINPLKKNKPACPCQDSEGIRVNCLQCALGP